MPAHVEPLCPLPAGHTVHRGNNVVSVNDRVAGNNRQQPAWRPLDQDRWLLSLPIVFGRQRARGARMLVEDGVGAGQRWDDL